MHGWANVYERFWTPQLDRVKQRAEIKMLERMMERPAKPIQEEKKQCRQST